MNPNLHACMRDACGLLPGAIHMYLAPVSGLDIVGLAQLIRCIQYANWHAHAAQAPVHAAMH